MSRTVHTFSDHLRELRLRIFVVFLFFVAGGILAYCLNASLLQTIQQSFRQTLYYTTPAGAFNLAMKISLIGGLVFAMPALVYNAAAFVQPALNKRFTKGELRSMTAMTVVLAVGGAAFAYYVVVPMSLSFFQKFDVKGYQTLISATEYVNFVTNCVLIFVLLFQLPLLLLFIDRVRPLPPKRLWKLEKFVVVGSLVLALILPFTYDPLTQFLIALPIVLLYNLSILLIMLSHRIQSRRTQKAQSSIRKQQMMREQVALPISPRVAVQSMAPVTATPKAHPTAVSPRYIDGFTPRTATMVGLHTGLGPAPRAGAVPPTRRLISDVVLPVRRPIQYQSRRTIDGVLPNRSVLSNLGRSQLPPRPAIE